MQDLYNGKSLSHIDGVLAPLMKHLLESMMDSELESQFGKASGNVYFACLYCLSTLLLQKQYRLGIGRVGKQ